MNGGGKQTLHLGMECVILGTDVVGVLSPISLTDNFSNKWKQVKRYLISFKYCWIHTHMRVCVLRGPRTHESGLSSAREEHFFAVTPSVVLEMR